MAQELSERLKAARDAKGWTQADAARELAAASKGDCSQSLICLWETGRCLPGRKFWRAIHDVYGIPLYAFIPSAEGDAR